MHSKAIFGHTQSKADTCPYHRAVACHMTSCLGNYGIHHKAIYNRKKESPTHIKTAQFDQKLRLDQIIDVMLQDKHHFGYHQW